MLYQLSYTRSKPRMKDEVGRMNVVGNANFSSSFILPTSSFRSWCRGQDSNLRRALARRVYSPVPLTTRPPLHASVKWLLEPAKGLEPPTL